MTNLDRWRFYLRDIESPDCYIDWSFIHLIGSALQRRVWLYGDPQRMLPGSFSLFANNYIWLVGPPSTGKGRVIIQASSVIKHAKMTKVVQDTGEILPLIPYSPDDLSLQALTQHMAEHSKTKKFKVMVNGKEEERVYMYAPCSFNIEELKVLFKDDNDKIVSALTAFYDSQNHRYRTKHQGDDDLKNLCVTMLAGTQPTTIRDLVKKGIVDIGMSSRIIIVYADAKRFNRQFPGINAEQSLAFDELLAHFKALTDIVGEVRLSDEASKWHKEFYEGGGLDVKVNKSSVLDYYYGRKYAHWLKLAMALLFADQLTSFTIEKHHLEAALKMLNANEVRMHEAFSVSGKNPYYEDMLNIVRFVRDNSNGDGGVKYTKLWWEMSRNIQKREDFDGCLDLLIRTGQITNENQIIRVVEKGTAT